MPLDPTRNLPALANMTVEPPPRHGQQHRRRPDVDDLPLLATQTPEEREIAISLGVHISAEALRDADDVSLVGRPYRIVRGRALALRSDLLTARALVLAAED